MNEEKNKPIEGEIIEKAEEVGREIAEEIREGARKGGVFIGTLNIMAAPARQLLTEPLGKIYRDRYEGKFRRPKHVFAFDAALVALGAAIAIVAVYFSFFFKAFDPVQIEFASSPKDPAAGGEVVLNYAVSNRSSDPLAGAEVSFDLPNGIKFLRSSLAYQRDKNAADLGTIEAGSDVSERLVASLSGSVGKSLNVIATLTYKDRSGASVTKRAAAAVKIADSTVGASFALPDDIIVGQAVSGTVGYWNRGSAAADGVVLTPDWPQNFTLLSSNPALKDGHWTVGALASGSAGKISWTGIVNAGQGDADFAVETGLKSGNGILLQAQDLKTAALTDPRISVTLDGNPAAGLGQTVSLTASYGNEGSHALTGAVLKVIADDGLAIVGESGKAGFDVNSGASGTWNFKARIADVLPDALKDATDPQLKVRVTLEGKLDGGQQISIQSPAFAIKTASALSLNSAARYWSESGDQLGRGPLPPEAGKATRYWIFWNAKNTTGAVDGVRVTGILPTNVSFTGKASVPFGDAPQFDPATRAITWNAGDIPAWPGVDSPSVGAAFEVALIPTPDQAGIYPPLVIDQKIFGTDDVTGIALGNAAPDLTAHLIADPKAADTGTVR